MRQSNHIPMDRLSDVGETTKMRGSKYLRKRSSVRFKTKQKKDRPIRQILKSVRNVVDLTKNVSVGENGEVVRERLRSLCFYQLVFVHIRVFLLYSYMLCVLKVFV